MAIKIDNIFYTYAKNTPFEYQALKGLSLDIDDGLFLALIGQTGSGKSSLIQHLNAILLPEEGSLEVNGFSITKDDIKTSYKDLRKEVGLVFQFSEYQLFEESVIKDVMFGPMNFNVSKEDALIKAKKYLNLVGIDDSLFNVSPFELSGGQKRRVVIAGILAIEPNIIVLDEPTAGLDPKGAKEVMEIFLELNKKYHKTLIIVSHDMYFVYEYANKIILMNNGKVISYEDKVSFFNQDFLSDYGIEKPKILKTYELFNKKKANTYLSFDDLINNIEGIIKDVK